MKTLIKVALAISLLASFAMADGEMGSGGYQQCTVNCPPPPPPCTVDCGGNAAAADDNEDSITLPAAADLTLRVIEELWFV